MGQLNCLEVGLALFDQVAYANGKVPLGVSVGLGPKPLLLDDVSQGGVGDGYQVFLDVGVVFGDVDGRQYRKDPEQRYK